MMATVAESSWVFFLTHRNRKVLAKNRICEVFDAALWNLLEDMIVNESIGCLQVVGEEEEAQEESEEPGSLLGEEYS